MYEDALALQEAGAFAIGKSIPIFYAFIHNSFFFGRTSFDSKVLEAVPEVVATEITKRLSVPTIGIGAGPYCSGQVLVYLDALGMFDRFMPRYV